MLINFSDLQSVVTCSCTGPEPINQIDYDDSTANITFIHSSVKVSHDKDSQDIYKCEFCDSDYKEKRALENHLLSIHSSKKIYNCESCNKKFSTDQRLKRHIVVVHERKKIHQCNDCDSGFTDKRDLARHIP